MSYYISDGGTQKGPFPPDELAGQGLRPDSMVWTHGMTEWQRADQVADLRPVLATLPPPPAAPAMATPAEGMPPPPPPPGPAGGGGGPVMPHHYGQPQPGPYPPGAYGPYGGRQDSQKIAAGICGILLGGLGVHKFILGLTTPAVIMLGCTLGSWVLSPFTCGISVMIALAFHVIGIVEGIIYLTKSDAEFHQLYVVQKKEWF